MTDMTSGGGDFYYNPATTTSNWPNYYTYPLTTTIATGHASKCVNCGYCACCGRADEKDEKKDE